MELSKLHCASCCVVFGVTDEMLSRRRKDGQTFFCPNGHANEFKPVATEHQIASLKLRIKELEEMLLAAQKEIASLGDELAVWRPRGA